MEQLASLIGWAPIALIAIALIPIGIFFYNRELSNKDITLHRLEFEIQHLKQELENSKQYRVDVMVQSLTDRVRLLNERLENLNAEKESEQKARKLIEQEQEKVQHELEIAHSDINALKERLKSYENDLDDLLDDYCEICDPDDEHPGANFINWFSSMYKIEGDKELVERVGDCNYCFSPQVKCKICGAVTSLDLDFLDEQTECNGGCGTVYTIVSYVEDKSLQYSIRVSRLEAESEDNYPF